MCPLLQKIELTKTRWTQLHHSKYMEQCIENSLRLFIKNELFSWRDNPSHRLFNCGTSYKMFLLIQALPPFLFFSIIVIVVSVKSSCSTVLSSSADSSLSVLINLTAQSEFKWSGISFFHKQLDIIFKRKGIEIIFTS